jgi:predicted P-loop ATPase
MLGFVHPEEGIGKTWMFEFMVPDALKTYYKVSDKDEKHFNMTKDFCTNFLVNFDEMVGITRSNSEQFKKILSSLDLSTSGTFTTSMQCIASGVFTSNKNQENKGFLLPEFGYRRFATIELDQIDQKYSTEVIVDQLWAEAYMLFRNSFDYTWNLDDFKEFKEYNCRYLKETSSYQLVKEYYRRPEGDETPEFKQPIEILRDLRTARKISSNHANVSDVNIGMALKALGFERTARKISGVTRYGYLVVPLF